MSAIITQGFGTGLLIVQGYGSTILVLPPTVDPFRAIVSSGDSTYAATITTATTT